MWTFDIDTTKAHESLPQFYFIFEGSRSIINKILQKVGSYLIINTTSTFHQFSYVIV